MLIVNIHAVRKKDKPEKPEILNNISFQITPGNIYSITGRNGSGKTTLLKTLSALADKRYFEVSGKVYFKDKELLNCNEEHLVSIRKKEIKFVFQDPVLSLNPLKKLKYYFKTLEHDLIILDNLLNEFHLPSRDKLNKMYSYELSGGMAQRLLLVLALSAGPELILLDEPNSGIDEETSVLISGVLKRYTKQKDASILMVTQDIDFALQMSDYFGFLSRGLFSGFMSREEFLNPVEEESELSEFIAAYKRV
jgi:ABC-type glutathione transport system ATPase component